MKYGYTKQVDASFGETIERVKTTLAKEGFGVLTEIDVQATLKTKIDVDYEKYVILGACNPNFAHEALLAEKEIGLLLPCNVIVYQDVEEVFVSAIIPTVAMGSVDNDKVISIANEVEVRLKNAVDAL